MNIDNLDLNQMLKLFGTIFISNAKWNITSDKHSALVSAFNEVKNVVNDQSVTGDDFTHPHVNNRYWPNLFNHISNLEADLSDDQVQRLKNILRDLALDFPIQSNLVL